MVLKVAAMCLITGLAVVRVRQAFPQDAAASAAGIAGIIGRAVIECSMLLTSAFLLLSVVDWIRQRRRFQRNLRMTPQEVREESREAKSPVRPRTHSPQSVSGTGNSPGTVGDVTDIRAVMRVGG
jgi:flagellar biosynthesis protein FlhB